jgi:hypothetical protein
MSTRFLKVKIKSLAVESRIIRQEELRSRGDLRNSLRLHRVNDVRHECRATLIAYNCLRGISYQRTEPNALPLNTFDHERLWKRVRTMVEKYGKVSLSELEEWRKDVRVESGIVEAGNICEARS